MSVLPSLTIAVRVRRAREHLASTPGQLWLTLAAVWMLDLGFFLAVRAGIDQHRQAVQTVGKDAVPSIIDAQKIKSHLAAMHTCAANILLHEPGEGKQPAAEYEKRRKEATEGILDAAGNISYGEEEKGPLLRLLNGFGEYEAAAAQARILHERGEAAPAVARYRIADQIMEETILPAADAVDAVNRAALDRAYTRIQTTSVLALGGVVLSGLVLPGALLIGQWFLYRRMRRVVNPGLAAATLLTTAFLVYSLWILHAQAGALKTAKEDAFQSMHDLWQARVEAHDASGDESRWLLDRARAGRYEKAFFDKAARIARLPGNLSEDELLAASASGRPLTGFEGYLAREMANITFPGEREAAVASVKAFLDYLHSDRTIRELQKKGRRAEAVRLCLGKSIGRFDSFDSALASTIAINQKEFDRAVARSFRNLDRLAFAAPLAALAAALLTLLGLLPRLREYAVSL